MNKEWLAWTRLNLSRGCDREEIRERLERQNYSDREIAYAMQAEEPVEDEGRNQIDYHAIAEARITVDETARRFRDDRIQLYVINDFLNAQTCADLCALINSNLHPSTVTTGPDETGFRTSYTCFLGSEDEPVVFEVDQQIAKTLGIDLRFSESIQGQKYLVGQEFKAHTDYFEPQTPEYQVYAGAKGQRTWTFMVYLNDCLAGGGTDFTRLDSCFFPQRGQALIWNNLLPDGTPNSFSMHHGMPVEAGEKYIITKWFRDREGA